VLVVDDDADLLRALKFAFEVEGMEVLAYADGESLLAQGKLPEAGCLVIDFKLPGIDGIALVQSLRRRGVSLPAILITSSPSPAVRAQASRLGLDIVEKPLLRDELTEAVRMRLMV
jgi:FixJ family two-component response regulator